MTEYAELVEAANALSAREDKPEWYLELEDDVARNCGRSNWQLEDLLDNTNWRASRPKVYLQGRRNKSGNLQLTWAPQINPYNGHAISELEFEESFVTAVLHRTQAYGMYRPNGELFWVTRPTLSLPTEKRLKDAAIKLHLALAARHRAIVTTLNELFEISNIPELAAHIRPKAYYSGLYYSGASSS